MKAGGSIFGSACSGIFGWGDLWTEWLSLHTSAPIQVSSISSPSYAFSALFFLLYIMRLGEGRGRAGGVGWVTRSRAN